MSDDAPRRSEASIRRRQTIRVLLIAALLVVAVALAVDNSQEVEIGWVFDDTRAPLVIILVVAFLLGLAVGFLSGWRVQRGRAGAGGVT